jgi:hypothetical protein
LRQSNGTWRSGLSHDHIFQHFICSEPQGPRQKDICTWYMVFGMDSLLALARRFFFLFWQWLMERIGNGG